MSAIRRAEVSWSGNLATGAGTVFDVAGGCGPGTLATIVGPWRGPN